MLYYERNYDRFFLNFGSKEGSGNMNEFIIKHLRKENAEVAYNDWIKKLRKNYKIEINREQWEKINCG